MWPLRRRPSKFYIILLTMSERGGRWYYWDLHNATGFGPGAIYPAWAKAEQRGFVTRRRDDEPGPGGYHRYSYEITYAGQLYLERADE
jgi:DNA-binding PadR family transcriptional regulator